MFAEQSRQRRQQAMILDACLTVLAFVVAFSLRYAAGGPPSLLAHLALLPIILPVWVFLLVFFQAYRDPREASVPWILAATMKAVTCGMVLVLALVFLLKAHDVSRSIVLVFGAADAIALIGVRLVRIAHFRRALRRGELHRRVLIVGSGNRARRLAGVLCENPDWGIDIVGFLDSDAQLVGNRILDAEVIGTLDEISVVLKNQVIDEVVLAIPRDMLGKVVKVVKACEEEGVRIRLMADLFEVNVARMALDEFEDVPLLTLEPVALEEWKLFLKRAIDLGIILAAMPLLLPVMAVVALVIRLDSPGPVLFQQWRVGQHKRRFLLYKFRTMVDGSEQLQAGLEHLNEAEGPVFKIRNDPRITRVGGWLRRASLDELPQLWNVLRGDMSLVGPRPLPVRDVGLFDRGLQRRRFSVKPGLTGLWQVSGRSDLAFSEWLRLDLSYIDHWSLRLDLWLLARTIPAVLRRRGAA